MENPKPVKKSITEKQKIARKKEQEYNLSSNESESESESESEDESFVVSKPVINQNLKMKITNLNKMLLI